MAVFFGRSRKRIIAALAVLAILALSFVLIHRHHQSPDSTYTPAIHLTNARHIPEEYHVQIVPLIRLHSNQIKAPVVSREQPQFGIFSIVYKPVRQSPLLGIAAGSRIALPNDPDIQHYIFLIHALSEESDWRVMELDRSVLDAHSDIMIPDVMSLQKLDDRPDAKDLWNTYALAEDEYDAADGLGKKHHVDKK